MTLMEEMIGGQMMIQCSILGKEERKTKCIGSRQRYRLGHFVLLIKTQ
jgi:hypothetical protein